MPYLIKRGAAAGMPGENFQNGYLKTQKATLRRLNYQATMSLVEALAAPWSIKLCGPNEFPTDDFRPLRQRGNTGFGKAGRANSPALAFIALRKIRLEHFKRRS